MYIASNDILKNPALSRLKNLRFSNTLMTSDECGASLHLSEGNNQWFRIMFKPSNFM